MHGKLILRNYRCFDWDNPAILEFGNGFTAYVGSNNSGKSAALRSVYELRNIFASIHAVLHPGSNLQCEVGTLGTQDREELANDADPEKFELTIEIINPINNNAPNSEKYWHANEVSFEYFTRSAKLCLKQVKAVNFQNGNRILGENELKTTNTASQLPRKSYLDDSDTITVDYENILSFADEISQSKYFPAFRNAINEGSGHYYDLPVGTLLVTTWDHWKAGNSRLHRIAINSIEKEIAQLLGFGSLQINAASDNKTLNIDIDGRPQKLHEVGAGVAQLIIVFAAAVVYKPPYILIDEPELSLHPTLQLNFLAALGSYSQKGLLYSTHSISLARSTAQRIYAVKKINNGSSQMYLYSDKKINYGNWLGELSYSSRVELGCEGLLLVEGSTDVLFFQEFLRKIGKDHKYIVMQLGGSSMIRMGVQTQLAELTRIIDPSKISVFIDSEKDSGNAQLVSDRAGFVQECEAIGIKVHVSERRATENYFEENGIKRALGNEFKPLSAYEKLKSSSKPWHKSENWRIARNTAFNDIEDTDLGKFLNSL